LVPTAPSIPSIYRPENRTRLLVIAATLLAGTAMLDWATEAYLAIGFLYLFPILLVGGVLNRLEILGVAIVCAALQERFSNLPHQQAIPRMLLSCIGYACTGLFISEFVRNRRILSAHVTEIENEMAHRKDVEEQLNALINSSPAAIVTVDSNGMVLLHNDSAEQLFGAHRSLQGASIGEFLPALLTAVQTKRPQAFRTSIQCSGRRRDGELFFAGAWFSTFQTTSGTRLAAIIVDLSEELRDREDLSFEYLLKNTRILMSAVSHEIRNLSGAAAVVHRNLSRVAALEGNADFEALGTLIEGLEKISSLELQSAEKASAAVDLHTVLDEARVLIDAAFHEVGMQVEWSIPATLPLVRADQYGLTHVLLNLAKNSRRAMEHSDQKRLSVAARLEKEEVILCFKDTGCGVSHPEALFRAFQSGSQSSGLGLYVSRAILRGFGGDLTYEPTGGHGARFAVRLHAVSSLAEQS
jgi:two-component system, LuxR family, sensor kinase FixL